MDSVGPGQGLTPSGGSCGRVGGTPHVVIVGAGFGGLNAALGLARGPVRVTLVDRQNHHLFQPLLYQVATAALAPEQIAEPIRSRFAGAENVRVLMAEATGVDLERRIVRLAEAPGSLAYDYLVLATGSQYAWFGHDEWRAHAFSLKTLDDAIRIRRRALTAFERAESVADEAERRRLTTFVIIGAGPTGVELAGAFAELARFALRRDFREVDPQDARILLVEAGPRALPAFPEPLSRYAERALAGLGVTVRLNAPVEAIEPEGVKLAGEFTPAGLVVWAAGVNAEAAGWLGAAADRQGRVTVSANLSLPGHPAVFVLGDAARFEAADGSPLPGLAPVAKQQGAYVARAIRAAASGGAPPPGFRYRDYGALATIGRRAAVADFGRARLTGRIAWALWGLVHIYFLIGFRNRLSVFLNWFWYYLTESVGARVITRGRAQG